MTRNLSAPNQAQSEASELAPILFAKLEFDGGDVLVHSGLGSISWGGDTYTGVGDLGRVSPIDEDTELARSSIAVELSGIPPSMISVALNEQYQGRPATICLGFLDPATMQLVDTPAVAFRGRMDAMEIARGESATVAVSVESRFSAWDKPRVRRYNHADQQSRFPGDRGLEQAEFSAEKQINWGQKPL